MEATYIVKLPAVGKPTIEPFNAENTYKQLSEAVGGYIERTLIPKPLVKDHNCFIDCFVNEEGLLKELPINQRLTTLCSKNYGGILVGDAIFVGYDAEGETVGLPEAVAKAIIALFN